MAALLTLLSGAQAQPRGEERHGGPGGGPGFAHEGGHGFANPRLAAPRLDNRRAESRPGDVAGRGAALHAHGFAGRDPGHFHGYAGGVARGHFENADWVRGGWHGHGPFLAYAGGRDAWDWRGAWGGGFWGPEFGFGWDDGWGWGGIALGVGIGLIVAPPVYVLPPPIYAAPPPVVLGLPAIAPPPIVESGPAVAEAAPPQPSGPPEPSTAEMVAASVPPPIVVSPPPYVVADAPPPPVIFAPYNYAFAIAPPVLAFAAIGPVFYSGGYFTGGYIARGYYGAVWDRPYWHSSYHYERPSFIARVGARVGLGGVFDGGRGYERRDPFYGPRPGGWDRGAHNIPGGARFDHGGFEAHRGHERG